MSRQNDEISDAEYINRFPDDIKNYIIYPFLKPTSCDEYVKQGYCKGMNSFYFDEDEKKEKDCVRVCLANCRPSDLLPLLNFPKDVIAILEDGSEMKTRVIGQNLFFEDDVVVNRFYMNVYTEDTKYKLVIRDYMSLPNQHIKRTYTNINDVAVNLCNKLKIFFKETFNNPILSCILIIDAKQQVKSLKFIGPYHIRPGNLWKYWRKDKLKGFVITIPISSPT
jgi:hypothetical protein